MSPFSVLLIGETNRTEFHGAKACLERWATVHEAADAAQAEEMLSRGEIAVDLIVLGQAFPGQFSHQAVDRLRRLAPLARIVGLLGSWCEGEMRTGTPWPAVVRTYWHQWAARCDRELRQFAQGHGGSWTLPPTAAEEERLLANYGDAVPCRQGLVVLSARLRDAAEWIAGACQSRGLATVWAKPGAVVEIQGATAGIFDASDLHAGQFVEMERFVRMLQPAPVIALLGFPRPEDKQHAIAVGAAVVVSKPASLDDLLRPLGSLTAVVATPGAENKTGGC